MKANQNLWTSPPMLASIILLIGVALALHFLASVVMPFLIGAGLAYLCHPTLAFCCKRYNINRSWVAGIITIAGSLMLFLLCATLIPILIHETILLINMLPKYFESFLKESDGILSILPLATFDIQKLDLMNIVKSSLAPVGSLLTHASRMITNGVETIMSILLILTLAPLTCFYILQNAPKLGAFILSIPPIDHQPTFKKIIADIDTRIRAFVVGQLIVIALLILYYAIALHIIEIRHALTLSIASGLLVLLPYIGWLLALILAVVITIQESALLTMGVIVIYIIGNFLESFILTPKIVGRYIGLHDLVIVFAILLGGNLFGFVGIMLAVPASAAVAVLANFILQQYKNSPAYLSTTIPDQSPSKKTTSLQSSHNKIDTIK